MTAARALRTTGLAAALLATVAALPSHARSHSATVFASLAPDSISGVITQRKVVGLQANMASSGKALGSYSVTITWDSTVVRLDSAKAGAFAGTFTVNYVNGGEVRLASASSAGMSGAFSLAQLYFQIVNDVDGTRTDIVPSFTGFNATDFTDLLPSLSTTGGVARVLPSTVLIGFMPDSINQRVGYKPEIDLMVDVSDAPDVALGSFTVDVEWNGNVMSLDSVKAGALPQTQSNVTGFESVRVSGADATGTSGNVVAARLYFSFISASYPSVSTVSPTLIEVHAARTFADLSRGAVTKSGYAVIGGWLRGDIDVSDAIAALDAQTILLGVVGLPMGLPNGLTGLPQGDADCNGTLSAKDAQLVLNYVVGNSLPTFCVGKIQ